MKTFSCETDKNLGVELFLIRISIVKIVPFFSFLFLMSLVTTAQLKPGSKVYLSYAETQDETNVNGEDATATLKSYLNGKTTLDIVNTKETAEYIFHLRLVEKDMTARKGQLTVIDAQNNLSIFESKWIRATSTAFYGYSGSRHVVGKLVKDQLLVTNEPSFKWQPL